MDTTSDDTGFKTDEQYRAVARAQYHCDGEIEIDENAPLSQADGNPDGGCYVQAWVWVSDEEIDSAEKED